MMHRFSLSFFFFFYQALRLLSQLNSHHSHKRQYWYILAEWTRAKTFWRIIISIFVKLVGKYQMLSYLWIDSCAHFESDKT